MTTGLHPGSEVKAGTVLELWLQRSPGRANMVLNTKVTKRIVRTPAKRVWPVGCPLGRSTLPLDYLSLLLGKQWLGTDKSTSQEIPSGDGPNGSQSAGRGGGPALPAARVLGEELQNNPIQLAKYKHPSLNHRGQVKSRKPESSTQETSKPA